MKPNEIQNIQSPLSSDTTNSSIISQVILVDNASDIPEMKFPIRLETTIIVLTLKGHARISINLKEYDIQPNSLMLITPSSIILKEESSEDLSVLYISSPTKMIRNMPIDKSGLSFFLHIQEHPVTPLKEEEVTLIKRYHSFIKEQTKREKTANLNEIVYHLLTALFYEIGSIIGQRQPEKPVVPTRQQELFGHFLKLLKENYKTNRSVSFYADKLCITPKYLSALSKSITHATAGEWIDRCVILAAKEMLKYTMKPIQEISNELNFPNQSFFGKYFKQHTGLSPKDFRTT